MTVEKFTFPWIFMASVPAEMDMNKFTLQNEDANINIVNAKKTERKEQAWVTHILSYLLIRIVFKNMAQHGITVSLVHDHSHIKMDSI